MSDAIISLLALAVMFAFFGWLVWMENGRKK